MDKTVAKMIEAAEARRANGDWVPACNRTEVPFTARSGKRMLYVWQPSSGRHAYLDVEADLIMSDADAAAHLS